MCAENKENANKKHNNLLQTTALCKTSMYSTFFVPHVLQGVEKVSKIKKSIHVTRARYRPTLSRCLHACTMASKKATQSRYFAEYACML